MLLQPMPRLQLLQMETLHPFFVGVERLVRGGSSAGGEIFFSIFFGECLF